MELLRVENLTKVIKKRTIVDKLSLSVNSGEIVGFLGPNGAGKSTLLKIMSRVTSPTSGMIKVKGRIASLLEVGTGFHPELTGRENIFLNGAILGMSRSEIRRKFDEIVAFAGVEKFLDVVAFNGKAAIQCKYRAYRRQSPKAAKANGTGRRPLQVKAFLHTHHPVTQTGRQIAFCQGDCLVSQ